MSDVKTDSAAAETPEPPKKTTLSITVDGRPHEANPGQLVIDACQDAGTYVPRFCYHPRMTPVGMCRQCLVEVEGPRGPMMVVSCMTPVAEGQVVRTDTPGVQRAQEGVLELLLANHPLDCPVCDKGGECPLQNLTMRYGPGTSRFVWGEKYHGTLDYVTGWHACALRYFGRTEGQWAFVTTNSITQGEVVAPLFRPILDQGWQIKFAHRTFKWTSEASGQAAVHCTIVGFQRHPTAKRLFNYETVDGVPVEVPDVKNISPYLTDSVSVIARNRCVARKPGTFRTSCVVCARYHVCQSCSRAVFRNSISTM